MSERSPCRAMCETQRNAIEGNNIRRSRHISVLRPDAVARRKSRFASWAEHRPQPENR